MKPLYRISDRDIESIGWYMKFIGSIVLFKNNRGSDKHDCARREMACNNNGLMTPNLHMIGTPGDALSIEVDPQPNIEKIIQKLMTMKIINKIRSKHSDNKIIKTKH